MGARPNIYSEEYERQPGRHHRASAEPGKSMTQQQFKDSVDITKIVNRFHNEGIIDHVNRNPPQYGFATSQTFQEAQILVARATQEFMQLPSEMRAEFGNDPARWLDSIAEQPDTPAADVEPAPVPEPPVSPPEGSSSPSREEG